MAQNVAFILTKGPILLDRCSIRQWPVWAKVAQVRPSYAPPVILDDEAIVVIVLVFSSGRAWLHTTLPSSYWLRCLTSIAQFQDILLRDQAKDSGGLTKIQKEVIQQHISHRLRFSLRVGLISLCTRLFPIWLTYLMSNLFCQFAGIYFHPLS
jgi:hypothetical protein